jgi:hypothetical protein
MNFWKRDITDPIRGLTLDRLARQIDAFNNGYLAEFALSADAMENRDDILKNVITKRKKAITRHGWEILVEDCSDDACRQREVLEYFYRNLQCSHALRGDERGGFQLLVYQMMDAVGKGFAVHEILWKPVVTRKTSEGRGPRVPSSLLTAEFRFVPLWYFEATSGRLRFVSSPGAIRGEPLTEKQWLVTVGDALMIACSRAFLFKHYPLQAWLDFSQKFGLPGLRGVTSATRGTPEFADMEEALRTFMTELAVVTNTAESIDLIELKGSGQPPFAELVERMDRVMASLWRGADLSTLSRDRGYGATLQEQEARVLEQDDAQSISEHLNATMDRWVLEQVFGPSVQPLARIKILVSPKEGTAHDLAIDEFFLRHGAKLSLSDTMERYGRAPADKGEPALSADGSSRREEAHALPVGNSHKFGAPASSAPLPVLRGEPSSALSNNLQYLTYNLKPTYKPSTSNIMISNSSLSIQQPLDDYIQISPIGLFPHARGFQNVDRTALENMVRNFNSFFGRLGRRFAGVPFYVGHPDVPGFENIYSDRKAYGWIMDLQVREDGLYARSNWSAAGRELIANGHFKFLSPFWEAKRIGERDGRGVFSPTVLKSVGLTNEPNLPVLPLANSEQEPSDEACLGTPLALYAPALSSQPLKNGANIGGTSSTSPTSAALNHDEIQHEHQPSPLMENSASNCSAKEPPSPEPSANTESLRTQLANVETRLSQLNDRLIQTLLDNALAQSLILPIERPHWHDALVKDFESASATLANTRQKLNSTLRSANLTPTPSAEAAGQKQARILALVNERMRSTRSTYHQAWLDTRDQHPTLFQS